MAFNRKIYCNFLTGDYSVNGIPVLFGNNFVQQSGVPGTVSVGAAGLENYENPLPPFLPTSAPVGAGETNAEFYLECSNGFTMVLQFTPLDGAIPFILADDISGYFIRLSNGGSVGPPVPIQFDIFSPSGGSISINAASPLGNAIQIALVFDPVNGIMAMSVDGSVVSQTTFTDPLINTGIVFYHSGSSYPLQFSIGYFATYDVVPLSLLPGLSVGLPPETIGGGTTPFSGPYIKTLPPVKLPGKPPLP